MSQKLKPIKLSKYSGRNAFSETTNLGPTEFRSIQNWDIYSGMGGDYLRTRRGSAVITGSETALPEFVLLNKCVFPTLGGEFFIYNMLTGGQGIFYGQKVGGAPFLIGGPFIAISGAVAGFISNLVLTGIVAGQTVYLRAEKDSGNYTVTVYSDVGMLTVIASGSVVDTTPLPDTITLAEVGGSGVSGTVSLDVDPVTFETGSAAFDAFNVGDNTDPVDMKTYNDRVYVYSPNGNKIIYYDADEDTLYGRPMGLEAPIMTGSQGQTGNMIPDSTYTYGLETLILKDSADLVASSPRRRFSDNTIPQLDGGGGGIGVYVDDDVFDDPYWTHIRLWRSKNQTPDFSNPLYPVDAQGTPDQLWEVALITRAEMLAGSVTPIDTGGDLPAGNAEVSAGFNGLFYEITDGNDDSVLIRVIGLDLIGLIPIPGCRTGTVNKGRIWASGIGEDFLAPNEPMIDPVISEDLLYTTEQLSQYQEQWDPQAYLDAGRDGKQTTSLQTFMEDVIAIRQDTTKRVAGGNPNSLVQMLDDKIGVSTFRMTGFIPGIGICAVCSDGYFRYLGFDQRWHQYIGKTEISQSIYDLTVQSIASQSADFVYMNGKLIMLLADVSDASGFVIAALGVKEGKGWVTYSYTSSWYAAFNFENGQRAAVAAGGVAVLEIEKDGVTTDQNPDTLALVDITASFETYGISGDGGLLQVSRYSFWGKLTNVPSITAKSSNQTWELQSGFIQPGLFAATTNLNEREYIFRPQPTDVTPFRWMPLRGQFVSFLVSLVGPAMISWQQVEASLIITNGNLGVFADGGIIPQGPGWNQSLLMLLNFEDPGDTFYDASGKGLNHTWATGSTPTGTKTNRVTQKPVKGVSFTPNGSISYATDPSSLLMGTYNLTWKIVASFATGGIFEASGKSGAYEWRLVFGASSIRLDVDANGTEYNYTVSGFTASAATVYAITFGIGKNFSGQFYIDSLASSTFSGGRTTTRAAGSTIPALSTGHYLRSSGTTGTAIILSHYQIEKSDVFAEQAKRFWGMMKAYG